MITRRTILKTAIALAAVALLGFIGITLFQRKPASVAIAAVQSSDSVLPEPQPAQTAAAPAQPPPETAVVATNKLFLTPDVLWQRSISEDAFVQFRDWAEKYVRASASEQAGLEVEGVALAKVRREALASLIKSDPERALELTVPVGVRRALPASVADLLEERISSRGRLAVLCALAEPGKENEVVPTWRTATISGRKLDAFAYGWRLGEPTRDNVPLNGIAVDNLFAVNENPVRILEPEEAAEALAATTDPICSITGQSASVNNQEIAADLGGQPIFFAGRSTPRN